MNDYQKLAKAGVTPEQEVLTRHFCYFGPVPESLYQQIKDKRWRHALQLASSMAEAELEERPMLRLRAWGQELGESARVWKIYYDEATEFDEDMIREYKESIDVLLVFVSAPSPHGSTHEFKVLGWSVLRRGNCIPH